MTLFFEGDDSTYVDNKMRLHGTGSEDYYNGGWYALLDRWDRGNSLPLHGCLDYSLPMARTGGYRFFLADKMSYEKEIYHGMEHGEVKIISGRLYICWILLCSPAIARQRRAYC